MKFHWVKRGTCLHKHLRAAGSWRWFTWLHETDHEEICGRIRAQTHDHKLTEEEVHAIAATHQIHTRRWRWLLPALLLLLVPGLHAQGTMNVIPQKQFQDSVNHAFNVTCVSGCSAAAGFLDNSAFTAGTTPVSITAGWFSASPTACTSGSACAPSMTSDRKLFVQSFQGTSPWVVSLASTTITGTVGVTQSTSPWVTSIPTWAGGTLGAMANYGTSPGAVLVPGVNAFITNTPAVTLTSTTITGTVAATQSGNWTSRIVGNAGGLLDTTQNAAVPANALSVGCNFTTAPTTLTTGNQGATQCNSKGELLSQLTDGTTNVSVISATNAIKTDLSSVAGTATSTAAAGVQLVGIEGRAGTSLETTAGVLDTNLKNVGNSAVVTAATGVQKVGIVGNTGATLDSASGAALPTNTLIAAGRDSTQTGGGTAIPVICDKSAFINPTTATTTQIVALSGSTIVYVCGYTISNGATAQTVILKFGTGAACATGTTSLTGTYSLAVNSSITFGGAIGSVARTTAGQALCGTTSAGSVTTAITVTYAQF